MGDTKKDQHVQLPGGFFLPKRQLMRFSALILTMAVCVGVSLKYSGSVINFDLKENPTLYSKLAVLSHLFSFASWFGCSMWISFVGGLVMFNNLPRHVFGRLQSKLFPRYFQFSLIMMIWSFSSWLFWFHTKAMQNGKTKDFLKMMTDIVQEQQTPAILHLSILGSICFNLFYFEPNTTATMFKRHLIEKKIGTGHEIGAIRPTDPKIIEEYNKNEELKQINRKFGMLHGLSTTMNLIALCLGVAHIWWLAGQIQV